MTLLVPIVAHLMMGASPHVTDILLYGGAGLGLATGLGLFFWGRHIRQSTATAPQQKEPASEQPAHVNRST